LNVRLTAPGAPVRNLELGWMAKFPQDWKYLGDAWERAYGDLEWSPASPGRVMPWYFLCSNGTITHGYGVKTGPSAFCYWTVATNCVTLHADVRCGGMGVQLNGRTLGVCTVVVREGIADEKPFAAAQAFCKQMCREPRLPSQPIYGFNDWYCTYGGDTAGAFLTNTAYIVSLSPTNNRPFAVVDDGWQIKGKQAGREPWSEINPHFSGTLTVAGFAESIRSQGARPGIWVRPLQAFPEQPENWRLARDAKCLDPTMPEVRDYIRKTIARLRDAKFDLIKHDFSTFEITGRWGKDMDDSVTPDGWAFADRTHTTAEIITQFYLDIREAAGTNMIIIGCNTVGHLAAGIFELQRIGDDTSGHEWARTRKMGVNCLAFRAPQQGTFFGVDADCVGQADFGDTVPWEKNRQWLELLSRSGTPFFVSFSHKSVPPQLESEVKAALLVASQPRAVAEPIDWLETRVPEHWRLDGHEAGFTW